MSTHARHPAAHTFCSHLCCAGTLLRARFPAQDFDESTGGYNAAAQTPGVWVVDLVVNVKTSVTCVGLPFFDPERPLRGTKPARVRGLRTTVVFPGALTCCCAGCGHCRLCCCAGRCRLCCAGARQLSRMLCASPPWRKQLGCAKTLLCFAAGLVHGQLYARHPFTGAGQRCKPEAYLWHSLLQVLGSYRVAS